MSTTSALHAGGTGRYRLESSPVSDDTQRALNFLVRKARLPGGQLSRRVKSCEISNPCCRITNLFPEGELPDAGGDGLYQYRAERIIKIFSVVSVVFLPPTLVAPATG